MSLGNLFPQYPFILVSPRGSVIRFGTHKLYVDLPWQSWEFMTEMMERSATSDLTSAEVKKAWQEFSQIQENHLLFLEKPIVSVFLGNAPHTDDKRQSLVLRVKWKLFLEYLEEKALNCVSEVEIDGRNIVKLYREILINFFLIIGEIKEADSLYFHERENFRKLLKRTGDYDYLKALLDRLETTIAQIVEYAGKKEIHAVRLYTSNFLMDLQHLHVLIDNVIVKDVNF